jgi:uncharacterized protein YndB with AHSA1/START domain
MPIHVRAEVSIARPPSEVFRVAAEDAKSLALYFRGIPPLIPGIVEARFPEEGAPRPGMLRHVKLSDGSRVVERLLAFEAPRLHRYDMAEMQRLQKLLLTNMQGEWTFSPEGEGCRVVWDYSFFEKSAVTRPVVWLVAKLFRRAMQNCLDQLAAAMKRG